MSFLTAGKYVRGFLGSDTLNVDTAIPLLDANGATVTLGAKDRLVILELLLTNGATASVVTVYSDANGSSTYNAGEEFLVANLAANEAINFPAAKGFVMGRQGGAPRAIASAASVGTKINLVGVIINS